METAYVKVCSEYVALCNFSTNMSIFHFLVLQLAMQRFTQKIVQMMKDENLFESQGGPIILSQVRFLEN